MNLLRTSRLESKNSLTKLAHRFMNILREKLNCLGLF